MGGEQDMRPRRKEAPLPVFDFNRTSLVWRIATGATKMLLSDPTEYSQLPRLAEPDCKVRRSDGGAAAEGGDGSKHVSLTSLLGCRDSYLLSRCS